MEENTCIICLNFVDLNSDYFNCECEKTIGECCFLVPHLCKKNGLVTIRVNREFSRKDRSRYILTEEQPEKKSGIDTNHFLEIENINISVEYSKHVPKVKKYINEKFGTFLNDDYIDDFVIYCGEKEIDNNHVVMTLYKELLSNGGYIQITENEKSIYFVLNVPFFNMMAFPITPKHAKINIPENSPVIIITPSSTSPLAATFNIVHSQLKFRDGVMTTVYDKILYRYDPSKIDCVKYLGDSVETILNNSFRKCQILPSAIKDIKQCFKFI